MLGETMVQPEALVEGAVYLLVENNEKCRWLPADIREVRFAGYTSCPGVVWVIEETGLRTRCLRHRLFRCA